MMALPFAAALAAVLGAGSLGAAAESLRRPRLFGAPSPARARSVTHVAPSGRTQAVSQKRRWKRSLMAAYGIHSGRQWVRFRKRAQRNRAHGLRLVVPR